MRIKQISYPHPVLASFNDDYLQSSFESSIDFEIDDKSTTFKVTYYLNNTGIENLIASGKAVYVTHLECESSMYRQAFSSTEASCQFKVSNRILAKQVDVTFMIVATTKIENYANDLLHEDYEGIPMEFNKGSYIAVNQGGTLILEKDPLVPTKSIFNILPSDEKDALNYEVRLDDHTISIILPRGKYESVEELSRRDEVNPLLVSMYYLPALMEALSLIVDEEADGNFDEYDWFKSLQLYLQNLNLNENRVRELGLAAVANIIFADISNKAVNSLSSIYL